jgi:hypothetical protein
MAKFAPFSVHLFSNHTLFRLLFILVAYQLKEVVAAGAGAPQVTSKVPIPMAEALKQDLRHGDFHSISWPGPALEYKHAAMNK